MEPETTHELTELSPHSITDLNLENGSFDKDFVFFEIIKCIVQKGPFKLLIFSDFSGTFNMINKYLQDNNFYFEYLEGSAKKIETVISDYKLGNCNILLINSLAYGAGLNLENTTDIILLHHSSRKEQFIGRAQRIGRTCTLNVHELLYSSEHTSA